MTLGRHERLGRSLWPSWAAALADVARQHRVDFIVLVATPIFLLLATLAGLALIHAS